MLDNCASKEERWDSVNNLVERWLKERQELIVLYCSVTSISNFSPECEKSTNTLSAFCQILLDYVSAGHFEVYEKLVEEANEFNDCSDNLITELFPKIGLATEIALEFNDRYDTKEHCDESLDLLQANISALGEILVTRFEMEDQLIEALHNSHSDMVA